MAEPSKVWPCSKASSSSAGVIANDLRKPSTSVNQSRMKRMSRSSTIRRTYSRCLSMFRQACLGFRRPCYLAGGQPGSTWTEVVDGAAMVDFVERLRLAGAQINPVVGDVDGNVGRVLDAYREAAERGAHLAVFPELAVTGYPPEDLVFKPTFLAASRDGVNRVAAATGEAALVVGFVDSTHAGPANAAALCRDGRVLAVYHKMLLPNYSVFDEERYFVPGKQVVLASFGIARVAITICEDLWFPWGPLPTAAAAGADVVVSINGSPYRMGRAERLGPMLTTRAADHGLHLLYVNQVGGQDELVFEGQSTYVDPQGRLRARAAAFEEELLLVDLPIEEGATARLSDRPRRTPVAEPHPGFEVRHVRVTDTAMPAEHSSPASLGDARKLADTLGIELLSLPIHEPVEGFLAALKQPFAGTEPGIAEENIQARARGTLLMSLSNKFGHLVLTTGNKSELAVGYSTLYGDMAGGFAVIRDVPKTLVYRLARWRNELGVVIPQAVLDKPPSAELRPGQLDTDSLPPYEVLDPVLDRYIEDDASAEQIIAEGFDRAVVERVVRMVDGAEYKRRQAPPGPKVTGRSFGKDRRLPITNRFHGFTGPARCTSGRRSRSRAR